MGMWVNDVHGKLSATRVAKVVRPRSVAALVDTLERAERRGLPVSLAGGRHSMGGQPFATDALLIDTRGLNRVLDFDPVGGTIKVEGGIQWPELVSWLIDTQQGLANSWGIAQKQTGADRMTIAGSLSANTHGRGLSMKPLVGDIAAFTLLTADGRLRACSRTENAELFWLAIGGYGLFGVVVDVTLKLVPRRVVQRVVRLIQIDELMESFASRIADGFLFGDFQYKTDERSVGFLRDGVFSCYRPVENAEITPPRRVNRRMWQELLHIAHTDKARAFSEYARFYQSTDGHCYWSDTHQLAAYIDDYHEVLDKRRFAADPATEVITEIFVPRDRLVDFMDEVRADFRENAVNVIYGTIRLVERDNETFLPWAKEAYVGVIFNLHTVHTSESIEHSARAFRRLIDYGLARGGSFYLTYHRFATREQINDAYPRFPDFLEKKRHYDPAGRFTSDWYRHYAREFEVGSS